MMKQTKTSQKTNVMAKVLSRGTISSPPITKGISPKTEKSNVVENDEKNSSTTTTSKTSSTSTTPKGPPQRMTKKSEITKISLSNDKKSALAAERKLDSSFHNNKELLSTVRITRGGNKRDTISGNNNKEIDSTKDKSSPIDEPKERRQQQNNKLNKSKHNRELNRQSIGSSTATIEVTDRLNKSRHNRALTPRRRRSENKEASKDELEKSKHNRALTLKRRQSIGPSSTIENKDNLNKSRHARSLTPRRRQSIIGSSSTDKNKNEMKKSKHNRSLTPRGRQSIISSNDPQTSSKNSKQSTSGTNNKFDAFKVKRASSAPKGLLMGRRKSMRSDEKAASSHSLPLLPKRSTASSSSKSATKRDNADNDIDLTKGKRASTLRKRRQQIMRNAVKEASTTDTMSPTAKDTNRKHHAERDSSKKSVISSSNKSARKEIVNGSNKLDPSKDKRKSIQNQSNNSSRRNILSSSESSGKRDIIDRNEQNSSKDTKRSSSGRAGRRQFTDTGEAASDSASKRRQRVSDNNGRSERSPSPRRRCDDEIELSRRNRASRNRVTQYDVNSSENKQESASKRGRKKENNNGTDTPINRASSASKRQRDSNYDGLNAAKDKRALTSRERRHSTNNDEKDLSRGTRRNERRQSKAYVYEEDSYSSSRSPSPTSRRRRGRTTSPSRRRHRGRTPSPPRSRTPSPPRRRHRSRTPSPSRRRYRSRTPSPSRSRTPSPPRRQHRNRTPSPTRRQYRSRTPSPRRGDHRTNDDVTLSDTVSSLSCGSLRSRQRRKEKANALSRGKMMRARRKHRMSDNEMNRQLQHVQLERQTEYNWDDLRMDLDTSQQKTTSSPKITRRHSISNLYDKAKKDDDNVQGSSNKVPMIPQAPGQITSSRLVLPRRNSMGNIRGLFDTNDLEFDTGKRSHSESNLFGVVDKNKESQTKPLTLVEFWFGRDD